MMLPHSIVEVVAPKVLRKQDGRGSILAIIKARLDKEHVNLSLVLGG